MSLIKNNSQTIDQVSSPLSKYFYALENKEDFPFQLALKTFEELQKAAPSQEDFFYYLLEDSIFSSLYSTFYEEVFAAIRKHPELTTQLADKFQQVSESREKIISELTQAHTQFVENLGLCPGCAHCDNHTDVSELIGHWQKGDIDFFIQLYIGMQTIQFTMEHLLYDVLPNNAAAVNLLTSQNILELRKDIYKFVESNLSH